MLLSGEGVRAHLGIVSGLARVVGMESGAGVGVRTGAGEGAEDLQMGVVRVESVSISISVGVLRGSFLGEGVVRSRIVSFFFFSFFGLVIFRGEGLLAFGVQMTKLRVWDASSSLASWIVALP